MKQARTEIEKHLNAAHRLAMGEVERLARKILKANPTFTGFCMAMGSATFTRDEWEDDGSGLADSRYKLCEYVPDNDPRIKEMLDFLDAFDRDLHLTGCPMRIDDRWDAPIRTDW